MRFFLVFLLTSTIILTGCSQIISATSHGEYHEDYGRRTTGTVIDDDLIETKIRVNLTKGSEALANSKIAVHAYNGVVLLIGQTTSQAAKDEAGNLAEKTRKVRKVHNEIEIAGPISTLSSTNDAWITSKIKSKMIVAEEVQSSRVTVITENGISYLMGLVTAAEADRASDIARNTSGVRKVVRVFEIISDNLGE